MADDDPPTPEPAESTTVVEWGGDGGDEGAPSNRRAVRLFAGLRHDRRLVPIIAGLGGIAVFGSMLSEWRVWTFRETGGPTQQVASGVVAFATVGTVYMIGVLVLSASLLLTLFSTGQIRSHARLVGLAVAAVLGMLLITATVHMKHVGGMMDDFFFGLSGPGNEASMTYGRGLYLAYAGIGALGLALWLAAPLGQRVPWQQVADEEPAPAEPVAEPRVDVDDDDELGPDWPWRPRGRTPRLDGARRPAPLDLTVEPATPFIGPTDDREAR